MEEPHWLPCGRSCLGHRDGDGDGDSGGGHCLSGGEWPCPSHMWRQLHPFSRQQPLRGEVLRFSFLKEIEGQRD